MPTIGKLRADMELNSAKFDSRMNAVNRKLSATEQSWRRNTASMQKGFSRINRTLGLVTRNMGFFAGALSVGGLISYTRSSIQMADGIRAAADAAGVGVERLQRLRFAAEQNKLSAGQMDGALQRLNRRLGVFVQTGGGPAAEAIRTLGLEQRILSGEIASSEQLWDAAIRSIQGVGSSAERSAILAGLFGDEIGPKMASLVAQGTDALQDAEEAAKGLLSEETVRKAEELNNSMGKIAQTVGGGVATAFIEAAYGASSFFKLGMSQFDAYFGEGEARVEALTNKIAMAQQRLNQVDQLAAANPRRAKGLARQRAGIEEEIALTSRQLGNEIAKLPAPSGPFTDQAAEDGVRTTPIFTPSEGFDPRDSLFEVDARRADARQESASGNQTSPVDEMRDKVAKDIRGLEVDVMRSQGRITSAIEAVAEDHIAAWRRIAVETPELAGEAATAIELIQARTAAEVERVKEAAERGDQAFQTWLRNTADGFADAVLGARSLGDAVTGLLKQLAKAELSNLFAGLLGLSGGGSILGSLFGGFLAKGGPVTPGKGYVVGEEGPEWFEPGMPGRIIPADKMGSPGGSTNHQNIHIQTGLPAQVIAQLEGLARRAGAEAAGQIFAETRGVR